MPSSCPATWALRWWGKRRVRSRRRKCLLRLSAVDCPAPSETPAVRLTAHLFSPSLVRTALSTRCRLLPCSPNPCHRAYQPPFQYTTPTPRCKPPRRLAFSSVLSIVLTSPPPPPPHALPQHRLAPSRQRRAPTLQWGIENVSSAPRRLCRTPPRRTSLEERMWVWVLVWVGRRRRGWLGLFSRSCWPWLDVIGGPGFGACVSVLEPRRCTALGVTRDPDGIGDPDGIVGWFVHALCSSAGWVRRVSSAPSRDRQHDNAASIFRACRSAVAGSTTARCRIRGTLLNHNRRCCSRSVGFQTVNARILVRYAPPYYVDRSPCDVHS
ncbi:hypothetical protein BJ546DRAFT_126158 [Cryomyces antarcticus]